MKNNILKFFKIALFITLLFTINKKCLAFERELKGSTGWPTVNLSIRKSANDTSDIVTTVQSGQPFLILGEQGNYWEIEYLGSKGYIDSSYCMINLPDIEPSIIYNITNASASIYKSAGYDLQDVTGKQLYTAGKEMNNKLGREEYICPILYSTAKMISNAQESAKKDGYSLMIYDSYRPRSVSILIAQKLNILYNNNSTVKNKIDYSTGKSGKQYSWGQSWFLAQTLSTHNTGAAIDVTLYDNNTKQEVTMPTAMHELSTDAIKYYSSSVSKTPANYSVGMLDNEHAQKLDSYMTNAGMNTLASEWWHFQDQAGYSRIKTKTNSNGCNFQVTGIVSEPDSATLNYKITVNDKYILDEENNYIYTKNDTENTTIINNITITSSQNIKGTIEENKYIIKYNEQVIKEYYLINISSETYNLEKEYLYGEYETIKNQIKIINGEITLNLLSNKIEIKYKNNVLQEFDYVNWFSNKYELNNHYIKVDDSDISVFLKNISCINCNAYIYDGTNNLTSGEFKDNHKLQIKYKEETLKEYELKYAATGISLNTTNITLNLDNNKTYGLKATINPTNAENKKISWTSDDNNIASVDKEGIVTAKGLGKTTITAKTEEGNFTAICNVEVIELTTHKLVYKDGNEIYTEKYEEGQKIEFKEDLEKKGYKLVSWNYNGKDYKLNETLIMPSNDIELTAIWEIVIPEIKNYKVENNYVTGIPLQTNIQNINLGIDQIYTIKISNIKNEEKTNGLAATGDKVKIYLDDTFVIEYEIIVKGDVTGTGTSTVSDVAKLYQYLKNKIDMEECFIKAGNVVDSDNVIKVNDVAKLYQFIKGKINNL